MTFKEMREIAQCADVYLISSTKEINRNQLEVPDRVRVRDVERVKRKMLSYSVSFFLLQ